MRISDWSSDVCSSDLIRERQDRGAGRRQHIQDLKFRRVFVIAARHAMHAQQVLRKERDVEAEEHQDRREASPAFRIQATGGRKSVGEGKGVSVRLEIGGRRSMKKKKNNRRKEK